MVMLLKNQTYDICNCVNNLFLSIYKLIIFIFILNKNKFRVDLRTLKLTGCYNLIPIEYISCEFANSKDIHDFFRKLPAAITCCKFHFCQLCAQSERNLFVCIRFLLQ